MPKQQRKKADRLAGLNERDLEDLVDICLRNFKYQTPEPVLADPNDPEPTWFRVKMVRGHYHRMVEIITKAKGWDLDDKERKRLTMKHEDAARQAYGDGVNFDFTNLSYGEMLAIHEETAGIKELATFRSAVGHELEQWTNKGKDA